MNKYDIFILPENTGKPPKPAEVLDKLKGKTCFRLEIETSSFIQETLRATTCLVWEERDTFFYLPTALVRCLYLKFWQMDFNKVGGNVFQYFRQVNRLRYLCEQALEDRSGLLFRVNHSCS